MRHPGVQNRLEFVQELESMNASVTEVEVLRYTHTYNLREELERYRARVFSDTWRVPDDIFEASLQELRAWIIGTYGSLDEQVQDEVRFAIDVVRFES